MLKQSKLLTVAALAGSCLLLSTGANAAVTLSAVVPGTFPYSGPAPTYDFDSSTPIFLGGDVRSGSLDGQWAQPYGSSGNYYSVGPSTSTPGTINLLTFGAISQISLIWGSVDTYNTINFLDSAMNVIASFTGSQIIANNFGNQTLPYTNPVVYFDFTGVSQTQVAFMQLVSDTNAFEVDNIAITSVPEPEAWAMLLLGFLGVGWQMRRRHKLRTVTA